MDFDSSNASTGMISSERGSLLYIMRAWCQISFETHGWQMLSITYKEALQLRGTKTFFCITKQSYEDLPGFKVVLVLNVLYLNCKARTGECGDWGGPVENEKRGGNQSAIKRKELGFFFFSK